MNEFDPTIYITNCCGSIIYSKYEGGYCPCECQKTFIDETRYYGRSSGGLSCLGKLSDFEECNEKNLNFLLAHAVLYH
jgi:hypothetical protein